jgi:hypothetical protein
MSKTAGLVRRMGMKKQKPLATRDVIDAIEVAAPPDRVVALLSGGALTTWHHAAGTVTFRGDIVGDHVVARFHVDVMTPAFIALSCESTSPDLGWAGTRAHVAIAPVAIARTATGSRVAIVHAGVPANGASRELWCGFLAELAAVTRRAAA